MGSFTVSLFMHWSDETLRPGRPTRFLHTIDTTKLASAKPSHTHTHSHTKTHKDIHKHTHKSFREWIYKRTKWLRVNEKQTLNKKNKKKHNNKKIKKASLILNRRLDFSSLLLFKTLSGTFCLLLHSTNNLMMHGISPFIWSFNLLRCIKALCYRGHGFGGTFRSQVLWALIFFWLVWFYSNIFFFFFYTSQHTLARRLSWAMIRGFNV